MITARRVVQFGFLTLTVAGVFLFRGNAERWCPFGGVEALHTYVTEGNLTCSLAVSNFYILAGVLVMTLTLRRAFCGYMCPIGTISEWLQRGVARLGVRPVRLPYKLDRTLSLLKYPLVAIILFFTYKTAELVFRGFDPCYALISRHGEDITFWAYVVSGGIIAGSLIVVMPFCRWLCPLAAVLNPFSRFGFTRITRTEEACVDCGKCAVACPMAIPVNKVRQVTAARCLSCLSCIEACPAGETGAVSWGPPGLVGRRWPVGILIAVLLFCTATAVAASYLFPLPSFTKTRGRKPAETATAELAIHNLACRGNANLLMYYLERDDMFEIPGFIKLEAWPGPGTARARITYDPLRCDEATIKHAITEPYYDALGGLWRLSPFQIEGYDPLGTTEGDTTRDP
ncbi:MAG: 4Fe-4S binding protein [Phycisphaerales bacterium]|nr:MAG: 4Fe-4S binding protein [Phycisphaerales bacterium]